MAVYLLKWSFLFFILTIMVHTLIVLRGSSWIARDEFTNFVQLRCTAMKNLFISRTASNLRFDMMSITADIQEIMTCPQEINITQRERNRVELHSCCNATKALFLTKENSPKGQKIKYETQRTKSRIVDKVIFDRLPKSSPWKNESHFQRCAVVGNGGILRNSSCGAEIDSADIVFRLNLAPLNQSRDVGTKTSLITINPSQIRVGYPKLEKNPKPLADRVSVYGNAPLLMPAFAFTFCTDLSFKVHDVLKKLRPKQKVLFFNPDYLWELYQYWKRQGLQEARLTTGLMLASVALELCDSVHLYGFWPFEMDLFQRPVSHHYYDDVGPSRRMHAMPKEFLQLMKMHCQGSIHLHLMRCQ
ncbi:hypothetical protein GJAV_G00196870 [Gymnothorax javanicus]|nr:hypothetical protein GJAV_G00196870 [Gymnothorax javanicus]